MVYSEYEVVCSVSDRGPVRDPEGVDMSGGNKMCGQRWVKGKMVDN